MGKRDTGTKHHCVWHHAWIGDISPGGCREVKIGRWIYCSKHEMPCRNGCVEGQHLKNQTGCMSCAANLMAKSRRERAVAEKGKAAALREVDAAFWKPGRERRKLRV
ncbi:hypothetical protein CC86DRAFT_141419 [Ophiobolus disseminans]|uniref:Uncharacterized protein n=1 Tax=Ophiobolus disseminans TaxID=1469910 RepID=A0A6A7AEC4_9PLEO|nr:hypothetical protein CC86DRAFT_141419 [Ophiobolus disseminans]